MDAENRSNVSQSAKNAEGWPDSRYAWYVLLVLTGAYILAFVDRVVLGLLLELIRVDMQISDTQVSLLGGVAFAMFYVVMGLPLGRLADRSNRRNIIIIGIIIWSCMTMACGLAQNFWQLFFARVGVGVGEAALSPAALSVIADYFPPQRRHRAIAIYMSAVAIGSGLAFISGGVVVNAVSGLSDISIPLIGQLSPWQMTFMMVGLPGLFMGAVLMSVREPARRGARKKENPEAPHVSVKEVVNFMFRENRKTFISVFFAFGGCALYAYALMLWLPAFFRRKFGWSELDIGLSYGSIILIFATLGMLGAPRLVDWLRDRGHEDALMRASFYMSAVMAPFAIGATMMPNPYLTYAFVIPVTACSFGLSALAPAIFQIITPNEMRAQVAAVFSFFNNVIGMVIGGTIVALITDFLFKDPQMLGYSLSITALVAMPASVLLMKAGLKPYVQSLNAAQAWLNSSSG